MISEGSDRSSPGLAQWRLVPRTVRAASGPCWRRIEARSNVYSFKVRPLMTKSKWILVIVLAGFAMRVIWWARTDAIPVSDFEQYWRAAQDLAKHHQLGYPAPSAYRLPGYPFLLAAMMQVSYSLKWLNFTSVILSTLLIYLVYRLALRLAAERHIALLAALICAVNPTFVFFSPVLASEHLFILLLLCSFLVLGMRSILWSGILCGLLLGAATLTRGEGLFYLPVILVVAFMTFRRRAQRHSAVLALVLAFLVVILPWYFRNRYLVGPGSGLSTSSGINFFHAHNSRSYGCQSLEGTGLEDVGEVEQQRLAYKIGFQYLSHAGPLAIMKDLARASKGLYLSSGDYSVRYSINPSLEIPGAADRPTRLKRFNRFSPLTLAYYPLLVGAVLSCLFLRRYPLRTYVALYGVVLMNWVCYSWVFCSKSRYRYTSEVAFCILASIVLWRVVLHFRSHTGRGAEST
jgi:4-amino-4-deoxy-L-arabinose transferase-like glycosyltransferase